MAHKYANNLVPYLLNTEHSLIFRWSVRIKRDEISFLQFQFHWILMFQSIDAFKHYKNMFLLVLDS